MYQNTKSATTAGLLGIFLGSFGAHNWYLGEKGKGIAHVCMMGSGLLLNIIASAILPNVLSFSALLTWGTILGLLAGVASLVMTASAIWGLVEGIMLLTGGDAALAQKGYNVAPQPQPGYGPMPNQGYGPQPGYGPMPQQNYGPMPNQGYGPQPNYGQAPQQPMRPQQPMQPQQPMNNQPSSESSMDQQQPMDQFGNGQ